MTKVPPPIDEIASVVSRFRALVEALGQSNITRFDSDPEIRTVLMWIKSERKRRTGSRREPAVAAGRKRRA